MKFPKYFANTSTDHGRHFAHVLFHFNVFRKNFGRAFSLASDVADQDDHDEEARALTRKFSFAVALILGFLVKRSVSGQLHSTIRAAQEPRANEHTISRDCLTR